MAQSDRRKDLSRLEDEQLEAFMVKVNELRKEKVTRKDIASRFGLSVHTLNGRIHTYNQKKRNST